MERKTHPHLLDWWQDDPAHPDRPLLHQPDVQRLIARIAPGAQASDLGGVMSLNVRLEPAGLVLRVQQPFVSRARLLALQEVRRRLAGPGLIAPTAVPWRNRTVLRCGHRWAELEAYVPHTRLAPAPGAYAWLFGALGTLHRALAALDLAVPRPLVATYAPPGSLRRWLPVTAAAVRDDPEAADIARLLHDLVRRLRRQWVPAAELPTQLVHGDARLSNLGRTPAGQTLYLDFGFAATRPRVHDLAYALAFMVVALNHDHLPQSFAWHRVPHLIEEYESAAGSALSVAERRALAPYTAAVPLYAAALDGFTADPAAKLRGRLPFLRLSAWLLAHPSALLG